MSLFILTVIALQPSGSKAAGQGRPLTPDDLFKLTELGNAAISPDGKWVAYVIKRPKITAATYQQPFLGGNDNADLWLVPASGGEPANVTNGASDGAGFWNPVWSPDSERVALLSTRGGNVRVWVFERASGQLKLVSDRGVDQRNPVWVSNNVLAFAVLPEGEKTQSMTVERQMGDIAMKAWPKTWAGKESTVTILDSGTPTNYSKRPHGALVLVNVTDGSSKALAQGNFADITLSPDKKYIAALEEVDVIPPMPDHLLPHILQSEHQLALFTPDGNRIEVGKAPANLISGTLRWSPDSTHVATLSRTDSQQVCEYKIGDAAPVLVSGPDIKLSDNFLGPRGLMWSGKGDLIVQAQAAGSGPKAPSWWVLSTPGHARNITASMKAAPGQLIAEPNANSFVGPSDGKLWRIFADGSAPVEVASVSGAKITSIAWPSGASIESTQASKVIVASQKDGDTSYTRVDLGSGKTEALTLPDPKAELSTYDMDRGEAVFSANTRNGSWMWFSAGSAPARVLIEANTFLKEIGDAQPKKIEYRGLDGQELKAWLLLPPDYKEGQKYPMVVWVYAGSMAGEKPTILANLNFDHALNLQLLTAHGYAVLLPSMPLKPETEASDPMMDLPKGVLPAVQKAVDLGYADGDRVGLMGQSYGGFSTYGLVTETTRFKAAIALAGLSDLVGLYGVFDARERYTQFPHEQYFRMSIFESGQTRMGNPPWKDWARYERNSPLFWVDRVETPLMIVQGDMDYVALQQGEEFFTALYRQHKRARFLRYWGEGHVFDSPANIRDLWQKMYAWFDEFLAPKEQASAKAQAQGNN